MKSGTSFPKHKSKGRNNYEGKKNVICSLCKKFGHCADKCYIIVDFPKDFKFTKGKSVASNVVSIQSSDGTSDETIKSLELTSDQYQHLISMLSSHFVSKGGSNFEDQGQNSTQTTSNMNFAGNSLSLPKDCKDSNKCHFVIIRSMSWIIDSGASNHMCYNKYFLFEIHKLDFPHHITLSNGEYTTTYEIGSTLIAENVFIHNVLYVPLFKYNLLSIRRLCRDLNAFVVFSESHCFVLHGFSQERSSVLGRHHDEFYFIHSQQHHKNSTVLVVSTTTPLSSSAMVTISLCNVVSNDTHVSLWHKRLGNLPMYMLKTFDFVNKGNVDKDFFCDVCPMARQKKLPFGYSSVNTTSSFDMIHVDTWGPYHVPTYDGYSYLLTIVDDFTR